MFSDTRPSLGGGREEQEVLFAEHDHKSQVYKNHSWKMSWKQKPQEFNKHYCLILSFTNHHKGVLGCSLWDGVLSSLDLAEELLRYAVVKGELAIEHGEQDHAKSPHVTGFTAVRPTCG